MQQLKISILVIMILILSSCGLLPHESNDLQATQTVVALQQTQVALAQTISALAPTASSAPKTTPTIEKASKPTSTTSAVTPVPAITSTTEEVATACINVGCPAPDFTLSTLSGASVNLQSLRGKAVLLNFWATWCQPCRAETPALQELYTKYSDQGLVILGVATDDSSSVNDIPAFVDEFKLTYPILLDTNKDVGTKYEGTYDTGGVPKSYFVDRDGVIRDIGGCRLDIITLEAKIRTLLGLPIQIIPSFSDDFSDPTSGWDKDTESDYIHRHYTNGEYHLLVKSDGYINTARMENLKFTDFVMEVDVRREVNSQGSYGLLFGESACGEYYYEFEIFAGEKTMRLSREDNNSKTPISKSINIPLADTSGGKNHLKIRVEGKSVDLYINDQLILSQVVNELPDVGSVGMVACTCDGSPNADVYFDNFKVSDTRTKIASVL